MTSPSMNGYSTIINLELESSFYMKSLLMLFEGVQKKLNLFSWWLKLLNFEINKRALQHALQIISQNL